MDVRVKRAIQSAEPGKINTKLWALVIATIEANPQTYDQVSLGTDPTCGSPCCQLGLAAFLLYGDDARTRLNQTDEILFAGHKGPVYWNFGATRESGRTIPATAKTIRASVNEWLKTQGYKPLSKVKAVQLAAPAVRRKGK